MVPADSHQTSLYLHKRRTATSKDLQHFRVLSWDAGGLSQSVFQELETYARDTHLDIVFVQETKWTALSTGRTRTSVHSAGTQKTDKEAF